MILYVLLLENEKFFLYPSNNDDKEALILEVGLLEKFVTVNKPMLIIETYYIWDIKEVDIYVKKYMMERGIQNVRGGSYCDCVLPEYKIKALENEFLITKEKFLHTASIVDSIIHKYKDMNELQKELEILAIENRLKEYREIKSNIEYYRKHGAERSFLSTLEWLFSYLDEESMVDIHPNEIREQYNAAMLKLQKLSKVFSERFPDYKFLPEINYYRPDIVFDRIFIHKRNLYDWESSITTAKEVYSKFEFMYYKMLNYVEELEFDLTTFPDDFDSVASISLKYLSNLVSRE
jgi:hypothetical protein